MLHPALKKTRKSRKVVPITSENASLPRRQAGAFPDFLMFFLFTPAPASRQDRPAHFCFCETNQLDSVSVLKSILI
jgi:hypothetical protein